jgi:putative transposase
MPRQARAILPGVPHHIFQRTEGSLACFRSDPDFRYYLSALTHYLPRCRVTLHAFVLMRDHVHLLVTPNDLWSCGELMRRIGQKYAIYRSRRYGSDGSPLWESRYRSCILCEPSYILDCYRYIELNPVRAGVAADPADYPWTSYRVNALGEPSGLVIQDDAYFALGDTAAERQAQYLKRFDRPMVEAETAKITRATFGNRALGSEQLFPHLEQRLGKRMGFGKPGRPPSRPPLDQVAEPLHPASSGMVGPLSGRSPPTIE